MIRLTTAVILLAIYFSGCSGILIHQAMKEKDLTPEEIAAYEKVGSKAYKCLTVTGPPPNGASTFVLVPQDAKVNIKFGPGCQLQMQ